MSTEDELWRARFAVKRAVLDVVAQEYHEVDTAGEVAHGDYLSDMLDEALKEYAEAYWVYKSDKEERASLRAQLDFLEETFNRRFFDEATGCSAA